MLQKPQAFQGDACAETGGRHRPEATRLQKGLNTYLDKFDTCIHFNPNWPAWSGNRHWYQLNPRCTKTQV